MEAFSKVKNLLIEREKKEKHILKHVKVVNLKTYILKLSQV